LERKNAELEAFCYSVSHDLRAPLRSINGFTRALVEDCAGQLDEAGLAHLDRVLAASARMDQLIGDLLQLSRFGRAELKREILDLSGIARAVTAELGRVDPGRDVTLAVEDGLVVHADHRLMHVVMDNLLGNAWKFTAYAVDARIEVGSRTHNLETVYHVRDNGAGFEMKYADQLFMPFRRLHPEREFPGTGIGLATVRRVVERHGGRVWAEASPGLGAAFYFTVPDAPGHGE
jgi:light-regulated signal transduction histidine kinase (bacteriophytochrome)